MSSASPPTASLSVEEKDVTQPMTTSISANTTEPEIHSVTEKSKGLPEEEEKSEKIEGDGDGDGAPGDEGEEELQYPKGWKVASIMLCLYGAMILTALDRTILVTAIPRITDDFHSINDVGWYGSSFLLTSGTTMLLFGTLYTYYPVKPIYLLCIAFFELGSLICATAPSSPVFILGRSIAGLGAGGLMTGAMTIMIYTVPLRKRPLFIAPFFAIMGVASVAAPLLGGVLTERVSWRWCFYINLPLGGVAIVLLFFLLHLPPQAIPRGTTIPTIKLPLAQQLLRLDPIGTVLFLPGMTCLLLAVTWGGTQYAWSSFRPILLLVIAGIVLPAFLYLQLLPPPTWKFLHPTLPIRILKSRSIYCAFSFQVLLGGQMVLLMYYLPIYFQTIKGFSPTHSGIAMLPLVISIILGSFVSGGITYVSGYYVTSMLLCSTIMPIGAGLLSTLELDTETKVWIGFQILWGVGVGIGTQNAGMAAQTVLKKEDQPKGMSLMFFGQLVGGSLGLAVGQAIFGNVLANGLEKFVEEGVLTEGVVEMLVHGGATEVRGLEQDMDVLNSILRVYDRAVTRVFCLGAGLAAAAMLAALGMEWKSVKKVKEAKKGDGKQDGKSKDKVEV